MQKLDVQHGNVSVTTFLAEGDDAGRIPDNLAKLTDIVIAMHRANGDLAWLSDVVGDAEDDVGGHAWAHDHVKSNISARASAYGEHQGVSLIEWANGEDDSAPDDGIKEKALDVMGGYEVDDNPGILDHPVVAACCRIIQGQRLADDVALIEKKSSHPA